MFACTKRLLLRPGWAEDAPALHRAIADAGIVRNLATAPWPYRLEDAAAFVAAERAPGEPVLLVFRRAAAGPELVGCVGIGRTPAGHSELGYWIARAHWGRGYATEAAAALIANAQASLRIDRLTAGHFLDNPASARVLEKLGFRATGVVAPRHSRARGEAAPCRLFELELGEATDHRQDLAA